MKKTKEDFMFMDSKTQYSQYVSFPQFDLQTQCNPNPRKLFCGNWQTNSNSFGETKMSHEKEKVLS